MPPIANNNKQIDDIIRLITKYKKILRFLYPEN